ncbi:FAD/NAD(P)-binding domain-containing protein [Cryphonectria parasitica EP155]|uniref:FAD/NAD(P)-binding domain-containing protein n=1 Tax=Cryphonectria parasitica (strain ATCC 38755 / EP155) TaxID=660469 RepID=A0A9P4Y0N4_CRYP1|nr:FAD/NAD(P)-binding domain-containing protein [Cryphonectria parasitica EP155]KAF3764363.1 FAD/NAD(P)-binding domain-containing protein [Cryphonectria parasitica EP155]
MKIIIIGAGLAGLTAAYRLAQSDHKVQVLERHKTLTPRGGEMNVRPSATRIILQSWKEGDNIPSSLAKALSAAATPTPHALLRDATTGRVRMRNIAVDASDSPDWGITRQDAVHALYEAAIKAGAEVRFGVVVSGTDEGQDKRFEKELTADLVLAADGIRSATRRAVLADLGCETEPVISRTTLYGVHVDDAALALRAGTSRLTDQENINVWTKGRSSNSSSGEGGFVVTRHNTKRNSVGLLFGIDTAETDQRSLWDEQGDIDLVRHSFRGACTELVQALDAATSCDRWRLAELPDLPRWTSKGGRVLLLGDSAHAMHPNAAQGFSLIIEDIAVLDFLLRLLGGRGAEQDDGVVSQVARWWQEIRRPRVERIKAYARWNTAMFSGGLPIPEQDVERRAVKSLRDVVPNRDASFHSSAFLKWALDYDAIAEVRRPICCH